VRRNMICDCEATEWLAFRKAKESPNQDLFNRKWQWI